MTLRVFSSKITFQILTPIFRFRGKRHVWATNLGSRFLIFDLVDFWGPKKSNRAARLGFLGPQKSKKAKIKNRLPKLYAQTCLLTYVFGILKKVLRNVGEDTIFVKKIRKKIFRGPGNSPKPKNRGQSLKSDF